MGILIDAFAIVAPTAVLDREYRGGTAAFLRDARRNHAETRYAITDGALACATFDDRHRAEAFRRVLHELGLQGPDGEEPAWVCVDPQGGPTARASWLGIAHREDGRMQCWFRPVMAASTEGPRMVKLSDEDGIAIWLDTVTGEQHASAGTVSKAAVAAMPAAPDPIGPDSPLLRTVVAAMEEHGWKWHLQHAGAVWVPLRGEHLRFTLSAFADEAQETVHVMGILPVLVQPGARAAVAELIVRMNHDLIGYGHLDLDWEEGQIRFVTHVDVEGGTLTVPMVGSLLAQTLGTVNTHGIRLVTAALGLAAADELLAED